MKFRNLLLVCVLSLISCRKTNKLEQIEYKEVFSLTYDKYLVCFYSSSCSACINTIELLEKRYYQKEYRGFLLKTDDLDIKFSSERISNLGVNNLEDLKIYNLPYLVYIKDKMIVKELFGYRNIQKENLYIFFE